MDGRLRGEGNAVGEGDANHVHVLACVRARTRTNAHKNMKSVVYVCKLKLKFDGMHAKHAKHAQACYQTLPPYRSAGSRCDQ